MYYSIPEHFFIQLDAYFAEIQGFSLSHSDDPGAEVSAFQYC